MEFARDEDAIDCVWMKMWSRCFSMVSLHYFDHDFTRVNRVICSTHFRLTCPIMQLRNTGLLLACYSPVIRLYNVICNLSIVNKQEFSYYGASCHNITTHPM